MGLDMFGLAVRSGREPIQIAYWRKHNALHGWMERLFRERGGTGEFNCEELSLTGDDLNRLEIDVREQKLIPTPGFFFGSTNYTEEDWKETKAEDLAFIERAREYLSEGFSVFYNSWW